MPRRSHVIFCLSILVAIGSAGQVLAASVPLARDGRPMARICLPLQPTPQEATAGDELARHLERMLGKTFPLGCDARPATVTIHVGATERMIAAGFDRPALEEEAWRVTVRRDEIFLHGGGLRGTLYAVWHFLETDVGVRWWTPWDTWVPRHDSYSIPTGRRAGRPVFRYRDIHGVTEAHPFAMRNRLNGHFSRADWDYGWKEEYGPPYHVHTFFMYTPPEQYFEQHPEFFSEIAGFRYGGEGQLCMSEQGVVDQVLDRLDEFVARAERDRSPGVPAATLFGLSQNDWGRRCECERCSRLAKEQGSAAGPLLHFVNRVADQAARRHPGIRIDTLAYGYGAEPPRTIRPAENVVVRLAGLYGRDFSRSAVSWRNATYERQLRGWARISPKLRIWDYTVTFGEAGDVPLPVLRRFSKDARLYASVGVDGVFLQHEDPVGGDLRDLKLWVLTHVLENPASNVDELIREFAWGFYGRGAPAILDYIEWTRRRARASPRIDFAPTADQLPQFDLQSLVAAQRIFERGLAEVAGQPLMEERLRNARFALDRLTLHRRARLASAEGLPSSQELHDRILSVARPRILQRVPAEQQKESWRALRIELDEILQSEPNPTAAIEGRRAVYWQRSLASFPIDPTFARVGNVQTERNHGERF